MKIDEIQSLLSEGPPDQTYRTRLLEFLAYEQTQLEQEKARVDQRLVEIRNHIAGILRDKETDEKREWQEARSKARRR